MWLASQNGHVDVVQALLAQGASVKFKSAQDGTIALMMAFQRGHADVVRELLAELKISHIMFFHRSLLKISPQYAIGVTFQRKLVNGVAHWMFQDVREGSPPD